MTNSTLITSAYFIASLGNFYYLKISPNTPYSSFIMIRGFTAIVASLFAFKILERKAPIVFHKDMKIRLSLGSIGMSLQIFAATVLPYSAFALLNRSSAIWFSILQRVHKTYVSLFFLALLYLVPFVLNSDLKILSATMLMMPATLMVALSQKSQVNTVFLESRWLMPLAPAIGTTVIGIVIAVAKMEFFFDYKAVLSGLIMTLAYWLAHHLINNQTKSGMRMIQCDLSASILLGFLFPRPHTTHFDHVFVILSLVVLVYSLFGKKKTLNNTFLRRKSQNRLPQTCFQKIEYSTHCAQGQKYR